MRSSGGEHFLDTEGVSGSNPLAPTIQHQEGFSIKPVKTRINEQIRAREIRVIDEEGGQLGILDPRDALKIAREKDMDLVEVAPQAAPPVCRIMNFGKYQYQMNKRMQEAKKHQKQIVLKEVKFRPRIDDHDFNFKKNNIIRFLSEGDKTKATVLFRGREMAHTSIGRQILDRLIAELVEYAEVEREPRQEGYAMTTILAPKKKAHHAGPPKKKDEEPAGPAKKKPEEPKPVPQALPG